ncbi:MAG: hypothetical protein JSR82_09030 [Verrucomicrobia bacterium]|nr:hypothetical protein [Verrucomicrobiota bacterium]
METLAYHYTFEAALTPILNDGGTLRPVPDNFAPGERPVLWFSSAPHWEPSATRWRLDPQSGERQPVSVEEMRQRFGWPIRFGWPAAALVPWDTLQLLAGWSAARTAAFETAARAVGADPAQWLGSFEAIAMTACPVTEALSPEGRWIPLQDLFDLRLTGAIPPPGA